MRHARKISLPFLATVLRGLTFVPLTVASNRVSVGVPNDILFGCGGVSLNDCGSVVRLHRMLESNVDRTTKSPDDPGKAMDAPTPTTEEASTTQKPKKKRNKSKPEGDDTPTKEKPTNSKTDAPKDAANGNSAASSNSSTEVDEEHNDEGTDSSDNKASSMVDNTQDGGAEASGTGNVSGDGDSNGDDSTPPIDCEIAKNCDDCSDMANTTRIDTDNFYTCRWKDAICTKTKVSENSTKPDVTCIASEIAASSAVTGEDQPTSIGNISKSNADSNVNDDKQGSILGMVLLLGFVFAAYVVHRNVINQRDGEMFNSAGAGSSSSAARNDGTFFSDEFSSGISSILDGLSRNSSRYNQETVPLSGAADDEWGWEDTSAGDVELGSSRGRVIDGGGDDPSQENEDLQIALALSLSENEPKGPSTSFQPKTKPIGFRSNRDNVDSNGTVLLGKDKKPTGSVSVGAQQNIIDKKDSWNEESGWDDDEVPIPASISSRNAMEALAALSSNDETDFSIAESRSNHVLSGSYITSLTKKPSALPQKKNEEMKKAQSKEDDIFASMGLSAVPKFSSPPASGNGSRQLAPSSAPLGSAWRNTLGTATAATAVVPNVRSSLLANGDDVSEHGSNWDDDSDLDDLLDD